MAQPHSSTKESLTDTTTRLEVDDLATSSSASTKSRSLELLQTLHTLLGAAVCSARTDAAAQVERAASCYRRRDGRMHAYHGRAAVMGLVSAAAGPGQRRCIRACVE